MRESGREREQEKGTERGTGRGKEREKGTETERGIERGEREAEAGHPTEGEDLTMMFGCIRVTVDHKQWERGYQIDL